MKRLLLIAALVLCAAPIYSQTLNFTVETTSSNGSSVVPRLTWTSTPAGADCTAAATPAVAGWSGSKLSSGTQLLPAITVTNGYTLSCVWPAKTTFGVVWAAPTTNTDGTALTNLAGFRILYGRTAADLDQSVYLQDPAVRAWTSPANLAVGNWYVGVRAFNALGLESETTLAVTLPKVISAATTQTRNLEVAIKFPSPPSGVQ